MGDGAQHGIDRLLKLLRDGGVAHLRRQPDLHETVANAHVLEHAERNDVARQPWVPNGAQRLCDALRGKLRCLLRNVRVAQVITHLTACDECP